ncbi:hypothetical protein GCM10010518_15610 [Kitasatospora cinereorecta]
MSPGHPQGNVGHPSSRPTPARHRADGEAGRGAYGGMRAGTEAVHQCCVVIADGANFLRQARAT